MLSLIRSATDTQILPLPKLDRGGWRLDRLREFLAEMGYEGLPADPRKMEGYREFLEKKGYKPNSVANALVPIRLVYLTVLGINTSKIIRAPKRPLMHLKDAVPEGETKQLLSWTDEHCSRRDRLWIRLMVYLGLREIEISRLDVGDFFPEDDVYRLRVWGKGRGQKDQKLKVENGLLRVMLQYHEEIQGRKIGEPMFSGQRGRVHPATISKVVTNIMRGAGVKREENTLRLTPHSLRHTAVTKVLKESGSIRTAQLFARHTDSRTTEIYAHDVLQDFGKYTNWED
jgi:integrase/recombinase XerD